MIARPGPFFGMFVVAHNYEDGTGKPLKKYVRFVGEVGFEKVLHVGSRENATLFETRQEARVAFVAARLFGHLWGDYRIEGEGRKK
jgi:hypothetical protein